MKSYRLLATLAVISGCLLALPAKAGLITVSGSVSNPGGSQSYGPVSDGGFVDGQAKVDVPDWGGNPVWEWQGRASSWGNESGAYGAQVQANSGAATAEYHRLISVTNNLQGIVSYSLDFLLYAGGLDVGITYADVPGYASASYSLSISRGATTLFSSAVSLNSNGDLTTSGTQPLGGFLMDKDNGFWGGSYESAYSYWWDNTYVDDLYLGTLGQGESMDIHIDLVVSTFTNTGPCYWEVMCSMAEVNFNDPGEISETTQPPLPITITSGPASNNNNVPEPGTLSLLALGLTGFALRARRNRRRG